MCPWMGRREGVASPAAAWKSVREWFGDTRVDQRVMKRNSEVRGGRGEGECDGEQVAGILSRSAGKK